MLHYLFTLAILYTIMSITIYSTVILFTLYLRLIIHVFHQNYVQHRDYINTISLCLIIILIYTIVRYTPIFFAVVSTARKLGVYRTMIYQTA